MSDISVGALTTTNNSFRSEALQSLDKDAFLELLVAQMKYQNPLSPVDSQEYLAQAAQYASVEQLENMAQSQAELRSMQMVTIATGLVGQEVTALDPLSGVPVTGTVEGFKFGVEPILVVDGRDIPLSTVLSVGDAGPATEPTPPEADGSDPVPPEQGTDPTGPQAPLGQDGADAPPRAQAVTI